MLKAYHEKPKPELVTLNNRLGLESPTHSKDCVGQVAEKEEDIESDVRLGNDQQPIKLQNSQILNDLGTKLSHLPLVQRKELAEVITQYREVFPDVPSKTRASKTLRCKNSNHCQISYSYLTERTCQISRYGRILQEFLFEFFGNCCTANKFVKQKGKICLDR